MYGHLKPRPWGPLSAVRAAVIRNAARMGIPAPVFLVVPGGGWRREIMGGADPIVDGGATFEGRTPDGQAMSAGGTGQRIAWQPRSALYNITNRYTVIIRGAIDSTQGSSARILCVPYYAGAWSSPWISFSLGIYTSDQSSMWHITNGQEVYRNTSLNMYNDPGGFHSFGFVRDGADIIACRDGAVLAQGTATNNINVNWGEKGAVTLLGSHYVDGLAESEGMNGQCSLCAIWDVPLTAEQVAVFNARPYALVEPPVFQMAFVPSVNPVFEPGNPLLWL